MDIKHWRETECRDHTMKYIYVNLYPDDDVVHRTSFYLKIVDTIGNCQRPVFSLGVSNHTHVHKINKFELNSSLKLRDNNGEKNTLVDTWSCVLSDARFRDHILNLRSRNQIRGKLLLSRKLSYFRGNRFSQCFIPSKAPPIARYQVRFYANNFLD